MLPASGLLHLLSLLPGLFFPGYPGGCSLTSFRSPLACHFVRWGFSDSRYYSPPIENSAYVILCLLARFIFLHNIYRHSHISSLIVSLSYKNVS